MHKAVPSRNHQPLPQTCPSEGRKLQAAREEVQDACITSGPPSCVPSAPHVCIPSRIMKRYISFRQPHFLPFPRPLRSSRSTTMATTSSNASSKPLVNLLRGWPAPSLLPADLIKSAANSVLSDSSISTDALLYGPDPGYQPLRERIAQWLTSFYQPSQNTTASRICITGGASQNLGCILNVYTDPEYTRNIWIVAPAYFLAFRIFEDAGFASKMRAVPEDASGLDLHFLRREIQKSEERARKNGIERPKYKPERSCAKVYKHVIYCVPTFANPSSRTMTLHHRRELVNIAREFDALVVCDDVYDFLQWPASKAAGASAEGDGLEAMNTAHLPRVVDLDREIPGCAEDGFGNACSNGSLSKLAGPGIRVGWVEGTAKFAYGVSQT